MQYTQATVSYSLHLPATHSTLDAMIHPSCQLHRSKMLIAPPIQHLLILQPASLKFRAAFLCPAANTKPIFQTQCNPASPIPLTLSLPPYTLTSYQTQTPNLTSSPCMLMLPCQQLPTTVMPEIPTSHTRNFTMASILHNQAEIANCNNSSGLLYLQQFI